MNQVQHRFSLSRALLILYCIFTTPAVGAQKEGSSKPRLGALNKVLVYGRVQDKKGTLIPGLTVSAVRLWFDPNAKELKESGERATAVTNSLGQYALFYTRRFSDLSGTMDLSFLEPGDVFIEAYWDKTLIYRSTPLTLFGVLGNSPLVHDIKLK